jgi:hypothetical protein
VSGPSEIFTAGSNQNENHLTEETEESVNEATNSPQIERTTSISVADAANNSTTIGVTETSSSMAEMTITTYTTTTTTTTQVQHNMRNCDKC